MLTTPWLLARLGYRRTYGLCMGLLLAGGVVGGLANAFGLVLAARAWRKAWPPAWCSRFRPSSSCAPSRLKAKGAPAAAALWHGRGAAPALGPSVGGVLVDALGWRSIFSWWCRCACSRSPWRGYVPVTAPGGVAAGRSAGLRRRGSGTGQAGPRSRCSTASWRCTAGAGRSRGAARRGRGEHAVGFVLWQRRLLRRHVHPATPVAPGSRRRS